jgi:hypothetical protein
MPTQSIGSMAANLDFDKFMDRMLVEQKPVSQTRMMEAEANRSMRQRAAREREHYLHSMRIEK